MARKQLLEQDEEEEDEDEDDKENEEDVEKDDNSPFSSEEHINYDVRFKCMPSCDKAQQKWYG